LGTKGAMSKAYHDLLKEIWSSTGVSIPREMKQTIQQFAPQFSGYQQHDSQELLAFLLDGLHEDLNRVLEKPYIEYKNEWSAAQAWEIGHKSRNNSVIVDLFQGQLKSRLRCPVNLKTYDQFDPFMYLTVPLPVQSKRKIAVTVYRADIRAVPIKYRVMIEKSATVFDLKVALGELTGINPRCLVTVDVHMNKFHREFVDENPLDEIMDNDYVAAHEILVQPSKPKNEIKDNDNKENKEETKETKETKENKEETKETKETKENKETKETTEIKEENEEPKLVRLIIYQKINSSQYLHREFFSTPLILSVPHNLTYRDLYKTIILRLSGGESGKKKCWYF